MSDDTPHPSVEITAISAPTRPTVTFQPPRTTRTPAKIPDAIRTRLAGPPILLFFFALLNFARSGGLDQIDRPFVDKLLQYALPGLPKRTSRGVLAFLSDNMALDQWLSVLGFLSGFATFIVFAFKRSHSSWVLPAVATVSIAGSFGSALLRRQQVPPTSFDVGLLAYFILTLVVISAVFAVARHKRGKPHSKFSSFDVWLCAFLVIAAVTPIPQAIARSFWRDEFAPLDGLPAGSRPDLSKPMQEQIGLMTWGAGMALLCVLVSLILLRPPYLGRSKRLFMGIVLLAVGGWAVFGGWAETGITTAVHDLASTPR